MRGSDVTVIAPVYNDGEAACTLVAELDRVFAPLSYRLRVILVDDGSDHETATMLDALARAKPHVAVIHLSRNFGHQAALNAGLDFADGDAIVMMDADLEHPPDLLPQMLRQWEEGADVVYTVRTGDEGVGVLKRLTSWGFYKVLQALSEWPVPEGAADFRLLDRKAADVLRRMPERRRFLRGLSAWIGFRQTGVPYRQGQRRSGKPKFTFMKMLRLASDGLLSMSSVPLRLALFLGFAMSALSAAYMVYVLLAYLLADRPIVWGWPSLIVAIIFLGGLQINMTGVVGLYIARIYDEVKGRPIYVVQSTSGFLADNEEDA